MISPVESEKGKENKAELWQRAQEELRSRTGEQFYQMWLKPVRLKELRAGQAVLEVPNRFFREWIEDNHPGLLAEVLGRLSGNSLKVRYQVAETQAASERRAEQATESRRSRLASRGIYLNPKYTFQSFVVGPCNQFAHAAARAVAEAPGRSYNPLFIYGGAGLGKTHLISAIGNHVADRLRHFNLLYVTSEQFTNELVHAIRHQKTDELKAKYRSLDLLLLDDVQFIEGKGSTQEELFHTLNALYESQKQIVISSDRPPKEIGNLTERLRSRFSMGLIADIQPPELETKIAIIHKKAELERIQLPEDVVHFLAQGVRSNIRELEGCLIRLAAHSSLTGAPIDLPMARTVLRDIIGQADRPLTVEAILKAVAEHYGLRPQELKARRRTKEVALPRQLVMFLARELTQCSLSEIGRAVGGKDHATVIYACKQVQRRRQADEGFNRLVENLINRLRP